MKQKQKIALGNYARRMGLNTLKRILPLKCIKPHYSCEICNSDHEDFNEAVSCCEEKKQ